MQFKEATDALMAEVGAAEIAKALKCSPQAIKQARMGEESTGYRRPPPDWEKGLAKLAEAQAAKLNRLAAKLRSA